MNFELELITRVGVFSEGEVVWRRPREIGRAAGARA